MLQYYDLSTLLQPPSPLATTLPRLDSKICGGSSHFTKSLLNFEKKVLNSSAQPLRRNYESTLTNHLLHLCTRTRRQFPSQLHSSPRHNLTTAHSTYCGPFPGKVPSVLSSEYRILSGPCRWHQIERVWSKYMLDASKLRNWSLGHGSTAITFPLSPVQWRRLKRTRTTTSVSSMWRRVGLLACYAVGWSAAHPLCFVNDK